MGPMAISIAVAGALALAAAQQPKPQPFPRPVSPATSAPSPDVPAPQQPAAPPVTGAAADPATPSQATLGMPVYPAATFLASFDAGMGQRYYLFGTNASYPEIVAYYRSYLREGGDEVFDNDPPTHVFEIGRFQEETMAYAPGITVKDYTWNGGAGYLHVRPGAAPQRFKTIIQVVPSPETTAR